MFILIFYTGVATDQGQDSTCYAYAVANVIYQTKQRLIGYSPSRYHPTSTKSKAQIVNEIAEDVIQQCTGGSRSEGFDELEALEIVADKYKIIFGEISYSEAVEQVKRRYVVAGFELEGYQWKNFDDFFDKHPEGVLTKRRLNKPCRTDEDGVGHAVVFVGAHRGYLEFKNSWGKSWGSDGKFKIENASVLPRLTFTKVRNNRALLPKLGHRK